MIRSALISADSKYRYWLRRKWADGRSVLWVMFNPSTANAEVDDPTVKRCVTFSQAWGFGELVIANRYAYRSSDPSVIGTLGAEEARGSENSNWLRALSETADSIVLAWGNPGGTQAPSSLPSSKAYWCIGKTLSGAPKHPLARGKHRVPDGSPMEEYFAWSL